LHFAESWVLVATLGALAVGAEAAFGEIFRAGLWIYARGRRSEKPPDYYGARLALETEMATGTVKWFNPAKGYGFIQPSGGGRDVFVHISAVEQAGLNSLNEGQTVEYEIESNRGKESAVNLKTK
jgi:cold shock protein